MSLIAKFAAKKAASSTPSPVTPEIKEVSVTVETPQQLAVNPIAPNAAPRKTFAKKVAEPVAAPVIPEPVKTTAVTISDPFAIFKNESNEEANSVLDIIASKIEGGGADRNFDGPFPLVKLLKGNSGGSWTFGSNVDGEAAGVLPVAKNPFIAQFLAYRLYGVAWETAMVGHASSGGSDGKDKPIWKFQVSSSDKELTSAVLNAGEVYQYTKGAEKSAKFDGLGHMREGVELLLMKKGIVFAVRLPDHHTTTMRTLESLSSVMRGVGGLRAIPLVITPYSTDEKGMTPWKCHALRIEAAINAEGKAVDTEFKAMKDDMMADAEFSAAFSEWNKTDVTEDAADAIRQIAAMKK